MIPDEHDLRLREFLQDLFMTIGVTDDVVRELHALIDSQADWCAWEGVD